MRKHFEDIEELHLAPYAVKSKFSKGRNVKESLSQTRTCFQRDRDRIIHSKSFRRLKHKTQVFVSLLSDHYRSRLTHTIEVAQISRHLSRLLTLNEDLTECIALSHDLGHTPFGHSGEEKLNELLNQHGGFEHNKHSLTIVETLEQKYPGFSGLNLSYEVKEGLKKHQTPWDNPNLSSQFVSLEAQIANIADEIAYNNHDIDDGLTAELLNIHDLIKHVSLFKEAHQAIQKSYSNLKEHELKHLINSHLISQQVLNATTTSTKQIKKQTLTCPEDLQTINKALITFSPEMKEKNTQLRHFLYQHLYRHPKIKQTNIFGQEIIEILFHFFTKNSKHIPDHFLALASETNTPFPIVIGYYIAGMTDNYAINICHSKKLLSSQQKKLIQDFSPLQKN